jgi:hypothetical protein
MARKDLSESQNATAARGRRPKAAGAVVDDSSVDTEALKSAAATLPALAAQAGEAMKVIGYELPYDRERVVQEARFYMGQSAEAMLEAGRRLLVLKEYEPHGEFVQIVEERLGLEARSAQRMMGAAAKFLMNPALESKAPALALLGKSKLFELLSEEDGDIAALAEGGTLAGKTLDDIDAMSVRELKATLREARADKDAGDQLLADKNKRIDQLKAQQRRIEKAPADEQLASLQKEATALMSEVLGNLRGGLRQALIALKNHGDEDHSQFMAGLVAQVQADVIALRDEFDLADKAGGGTPEWMRFQPGSNAETSAPVTHGRAAS